MADEKIINDDVDVSRCEHYNICGQCELSQLPESSYKLRCRENSDCNFKQLSRKTAECEELISEKDFYLQKIETLEDKCEELKATIRNLQISNTKLQNNNQQLDGAITKAKCYEQALNDIEKLISEWYENEIIQYQSDYDNLLDIINKAKEQK